MSLDYRKDYRGNNQTMKAYKLQSDLTVRGTTAGGAAAEVVTVAGAVVGDIAQVTIEDIGTGAAYIISSKVTDADEVTMTFNADPTADCDYVIQIFAV